MKCTRERDCVLALSILPGIGKRAATMTRFYTELLLATRSSVSAFKKKMGLLKPDLHPKETMICIWWVWANFIYWQILEKDEMVSKDLYLVQLH